MTLHVLRRLGRSRRLLFSLLLVVVVAFAAPAVTTRLLDKPLSTSDRFMRAFVANDAAATHSTMCPDDQLDIPVDVLAAAWQGRVERMAAGRLSESYKALGSGVLNDGRVVSVYVVTTVEDGRGAERVWLVYVENDCVGSVQ